MNRELVISVLYDIALVIGGEVSVKPLLIKTLQRLLYHTSFPTGMIFLDLPLDEGSDTITTQLDAAVGDFGFAGLVGTPITVPARLLRGGPEVVEAPELLQLLPGASRPYGVFLRLPIDHQGVMLLLAPRQPSTELPLTQVFQPVMANLARAITLCRHNDAYTAALAAERDVAKESLRESEEKFRSITTVAQDAILMVDDEGRLAYWNPAAERIFGYRAEEVLGQEMHHLIAPERYYEAFKQGFDRFSTSGRGPIIGKTMELEARHRDGHEFPVELSISALNLNSRWHAVGTLRDITMRRQNEQALLHSEKSLKEAQRIALLGSWEFDLRNNVLTWSEEIYRIFEIEAKTFKATYEAFLGAVHPDDRQMVNRAYRTALEEHRDYEIVHRLLMADGRVKYISERGETLYDSDGRPLRTLGTVQDITRQRESELALQRALIGTIQAVALTVEKRDPYTAGHQQKVARLAVAIAGELGWSEEKIEGVRLGATIHDIGKIYIPAEILNRPGKLSELEYAVIQKHPQVGFDIIKDVEFPWPVAQIILQHHERLDGSGYPNQLHAAEIIPEARVLAVADLVEAMSSHRPYRPALGVEAGLREVTQYRGTRFDSEVVDACLRVFRDHAFSFD